LFKETIKHEAPDRTSIWTDTNVYNELGNPRDQNRSSWPAQWPGPNEEIDIDVITTAAKLYALIALDICTRPR
jgi:hypothetical protein